jgi:hypothetical protein
MSKETHWHWRNCRSVEFGVGFNRSPWWPIIYTDEGIYGGTRHVVVGPVMLWISYSIGHSSSENPVVAMMGLSLEEVERRVEKYQSEKPLWESVVEWFRGLRTR